MSEPKKASTFTIEKNKALYEDPVLDWEDKIDFENAQRGFIARMEDLVIRNEDGEIVWELTPYGFLEDETA
ncbi:MBL fold metallo-hydrolase, partial [Thermodesulfobacteriota bacterium]